MKTKEFKGKLTPIQVTEALSEIKDATDIKELSAEEEGLSVEEYETRHGRKEVKPLPQKSENSFDAKHFLLMGWLFDNMPEEFRNNSRARIVFPEVLLEKEFLNIWNCKISIPEGLTEEALIRYSSQKIEELESLSVFKLNSKEIALSKNKDEAIKKIEEEIKSQKERSKNGCPSMGTLQQGPKFRFKLEVSFYFKWMIVIQKLEEILDIVEHYKPV